MKNVRIAHIKSDKLTRTVFVFIASCQAKHRQPWLLLKDDMIRAYYHSDDWRSDRVDY